MKQNYNSPVCFALEVSAGKSFLQASGLGGDFENNPIGRFDDEDL